MYILILWIYNLCMSLVKPQFVCCYIRMLTNVYCTCMKYLTMIIAKNYKVINMTNLSIPLNCYALYVLGMKFAQVT